MPPIITVTVSSHRRDDPLHPSVAWLICMEQMQIDEVVCGIRYTPLILFKSRALVEPTDDNRKLIIQTITDNLPLPIGNNKSAKSRRSIFAAVIDRKDPTTTELSIAGKIK